VPGNTGTMPQLRAPVCFVLFASTLALPCLASASEPAPPAEKAAAPDADDSAAHLTALELMVRPTLGGAGGSSLVHIDPSVPGSTSKVFNGTASPYGASFGVGAEIGFRFHPVIAAGLRADFSKVSATAPSDGTTDLSRSRQSAGLYLRAYPLALTPSVRKHIDPWVSTGAVYMRDAQSYNLPAATSTGGAVDSSVKLTHHGVGIPIALGVDYRVTRAISIGPSFEYTFLVPIAGCASQTAAGYQGNEICSGGNSASSKAVIADATGAWTAGLDLRFTPF
jgi:opacity protein-like surface antigen